MTETPQPPQEHVYLPGTERPSIPKPVHVVPTSEKTSVSAGIPPKVTVAPAKPVPEKPVGPAGPFIKYGGMATLRIIEREEWEARGIKNQGTVKWDAFNGYKIPVSELTADAVSYCLNTDGRFIKVD